MKSTILIFCTMLFAFSIQAESISCKEHHCITIVDAGSTGSRAHLYTYDLDSTNNPIQIKEVWSKKINPGIATLNSDDQTINPYIQNLLSDAPAKTPLYFYATGGMRVLPYNKQQTYYQSLRRYFAQQSQWQLKEAKTLTGQEEALYDWLSINYYLGNFKETPSKTVGVMDMGGASVQIAFPVTSSITTEENDLIKVKVYGQEYNLAVYSFLGLGQTELSHQFLNSESCFSNDYILPNGKPGKGNASACAQEISSLINGVHGVDKVVPPLLAYNLATSWYAIGGISNLAEDAFHLEQGTFTNQNLLELADNQICTQNWDKLANQFPKDDYAYGYCLFSSYFYALMVQGYRFSPEATIYYGSVKSNLNWTQGVVLHQP